MSSPLSRTLPVGLLLVLNCLAHAQSPDDWPRPRKVDVPRAAAAGIRVIVGKHLRLWTDVAVDPAVEELPAAFDAAVPQWAEYFGIPAAKYEGWQVQGFLIKDRAKFAALGLLSERNPDFVNGYALGNELWFEEQPSDYYRRHLLLHEGTHSFMLAFRGGMGPGWYAEGMAELLGTHQWSNGRLAIGVIPSDKESVPMWGRIKLIRDAVAQNKQLALGDVLSISNRQALSVDAYAWCWALATFLDSHPRYSAKFRKLQSLVREPDFNTHLRKAFHREWPDMQFEWQAFVATLDYGYDTERMAIVFPKPLKGSTTSQVDAGRGWQQTSLRLRKGQTYQLAATGRYQIAHDGEPWPCEPGGVTLRYHDGFPLGMLLGVLRYEDKSDEPFAVIPIGLQNTLTPSDDAVLYLRVNDSPAELSDNQGLLEVRIESVHAAD